MKMKNNQSNAVQGANKAGQVCASERGRVLPQARMNAKNRKEELGIREKEGKCY